MKGSTLITSVLLVAPFLAHGLGQRVPNAAWTSSPAPSLSSPTLTPILGFSTFLGGSGSETGNALAVDAAGNLYIAGTTTAPALLGGRPLPGATGGGVDVFVAKLDPTGTNLLYLVWLGGSGDDYVNGIALDGTNVCLTGSTLSPDFPAFNAPGPAASGGNAFVAKINGPGTGFVFCTCLGGSNDDCGQGIAIDKQGNLWVTGWTDSPDFPTQNPLQPGAAGRNAFVTKLDPNGARVLFSTLLGGADDDSGESVAVDNAGNAYVTGSTSSTDFPTAHALQSAFAGRTDAFVTALKADGSGLIYSTFLGGSDTDRGLGISVDGPGNAFVTGQTLSPDFPLTHPLQQPGGDSDAFVAQIAPGGTAWVFSTPLGGSGYDLGQAVQVDAAGQVCVTGQTSSPDFPKVNAFQGQYAGGPADAFVAKLKLGGSGLVYSSWLGSSGQDAGQAIAVDGGGNEYVTGSTRPITKDLQFPTSPGAWQAGFGGGYRDAFVSRISGTSARPGNDNLADAWTLSGSLLTTLGGNVNASREPQEPTQGGVAGGKSVWWKWRAPAAGTVILSTKGSDFDTVLAAYKGANWSDLQLVAANDDEPVQGTTSRLYFEAEAGATYMVEVDGKNGASGNIMLTLSLGLVPNDDFAYRIAITNLPATIVASNVGATAEPGEPNQFEYYYGGSSVWWSWTAPANMKVAIDTTGSDFGPRGEPAVVVYTGSSLAELAEHQVASNYQNTKNPMIFTAQAGVTYQISADGDWISTPSGSIMLRLYQTTTSVNDDFGNRGDLSSSPLPITMVTNLANASTEPGEVPWYGGAGCTLWWTYTAHSNINLMITTTTSVKGYPPLLRVFTGEPLSELNQMAGMSWGMPCATPAMDRVIFRAIAGTHYQIGIDACSAPGEATLSLEQVAPPPNDDFAQAVVLTGVSVTATGSTFGATYESSDEPRREGGYGSIWWSWTPPTNGNVELSLAGSTPTHALLVSVWSGDSLSTLQSIARNPPIYDRSLQFPCGSSSELTTFKATAGQTYFIAADGASLPAWTVALSLKMVPPPLNDDFASALSLSGLSNAVNTSNIGATNEDAERQNGHAGEPGGQSLWWNWTAPTSGRAILDTTGSKVPVALGVYVGDGLGSLQEIASNLLPGSAQFHTNRFSLVAVAGTTYRIAVDSMGQTGDVVFSLVEQPALRFDSAEFDAQGKLKMGIGGATLNRFALQVSTNLTQWLPLTTNSLVNQSCFFSDPDSSRSDRANHRFYRAVELP